MSNTLKLLVAAGVIAGFLGVPQVAPAQLDHLPYMLKYNKGQNIQPIFQGWSRNPDGSYEMHLGYLNRNYLEELHVPIGPDNHIEPGGPDQGQPTYFYTRNNRQIFSVTVPADFGNRELIWTLTIRGKTEQAVGWLQPEWEINPDTGGRQLGEDAGRHAQSAHEHLAAGQADAHRQRHGRRPPYASRQPSATAQPRGRPGDSANSGAARGDAGAAYEPAAAQRQCARPAEQAVSAGGLVGVLHRVARTDGRQVRADVRDGGRRDRRYRGYFHTAGRLRAAGPRPRRRQVDLRVHQRHRQLSDVPPSTGMRAPLV